MSRSTGVTLKVNRLQLIEKLESALEKQHVQFILNTEKYDKEVEKKTATAIKKLQAKLDAEDIDFSYNGAEVRVPIKLSISKPSKPKLDEINLQLRKLRLSVDDVVTISDRSDYFKYL